MKKKTLAERFSPPSEDDLSEEVKDAIKAMNRAGKKLRERKKALGHKLVIWKEGEACAIEL